MKKSVKIILSIIIAIALGLGIYFRNQQIKQAEIDANPEGKPVVKIGVIMPLSTAASVQTTNLKNAELFIAEQYKNAAVRFKVIAEDSAGQGARVISAAKKLIYIDKVDVLFTHLSGEAKLVGPLAAKENKLQISTVIDADLEKNPTSFTFWAIKETIADKLVDYLNKNEAKKIAVLVSNMSTMNAYYSGLEVAFDKAGIKHDKYTITPGEKDYRIDLLKIKEANYDMVVFQLWAPEVDVIRKQYLELGIETPITATDSIVVSNHKDYFEGVKYINVNPGDTKIIEPLNESAKLMPQHTTAYIYDAFKIINKIANDFYKKNKRLPNGIEYTQMLLDMKTFNDGALGEVTISPNRQIHSKPILMQIQNGKEVIIEE